MTRSLLARSTWARVVAALRSENGLLIGLDLDGTLAPIVHHPERARVPRRTLRLLERATRARRVRIAVISARPLVVMRGMLPVRGILRVGQYGLEGPLAPPVRERASLRAACAEIARGLNRVAAEFPGAWIERKGLSVAIHDRAVPPSRLRPLHRAVVARVAPVARRRGFRAVPGSRVTDFIPAGFDKGTALRGIARGYGPGAVFYFGDSGGDEPAFRAMRPDDFAVRVGPGPTRARYRVADLRGVTRVLAEVLRLRAE